MIKAGESCLMVCSTVVSFRHRFHKPPSNNAPSDDHDDDDGDGDSQGHRWVMILIIGQKFLQMRRKKEDVAENVQLDDLILETIYCWSWIVLVCGSLQR